MATELPRSMPSVRLLHDFKPKVLPDVQRVVAPHALPVDEADGVRRGRYYRVFVPLVSRVSSLDMNHGSFCTISVIRYGRRHEMKYQKESVKIDTESCLISLL
jgi:hypothetical protein